MMRAADIRKVRRYYRAGRIDVAAQGGGMACSVSAQMIAGSFTAGMAMLFSTPLIQSQQPQHLVFNAGLLSLAAGVSTLVSAIAPPFLLHVGYDYNDGVDGLMPVPKKGLTGMMVWPARVLFNTSIAGRTLGNYAQWVLTGTGRMARPPNAPRRILTPMDEIDGNR